MIPDRSRPAPLSLLITLFSTEHSLMVHIVTGVYGLLMVLIVTGVYGMVLIVTGVYGLLMVLIITAV